MVKESCPDVVGLNSNGSRENISRSRWIIQSICRLLIFLWKLEYVNKRDCYYQSLCLAPSKFKPMVKSTTPAIRLIPFNFLLKKKKKQQRYEVLNSKPQLGKLPFFIKYDNFFKE